jgi:AmmeMemoRadiSam system protein B
MRISAKLIVLAVALVILMCREKPAVVSVTAGTRQLVDTIGFAQYAWQMDSIVSRMKQMGWSERNNEPWKLAVCPHDDYAYAGSIYVEILQNIKARVVILIGVAHRASQLGIEDMLVFETNRFWKGPWSDVKVSEKRENLLGFLGEKYSVVNDTLHSIEHSVESMIPFLQHFSREVEIIPLLVPAMSPDRMEECGKALADAIGKVAAENSWNWGEDFAIVVTTDAVHYGNEDWGGADRAFYGCDNHGNEMARHMDYEIIDNCLRGRLSTQRIRKFSSYTLNADNYREYKWTWCGRYSVPVALYASYYLNGSAPLKGELVDYSTSITRLHVPVHDLRMGVTAIATKCHWVGYAALGYR